MLKELLGKGKYVPIVVFYRLKKNNGTDHFLRPHIRNRYYMDIMVNVLSWTLTQLAKLAKLSFANIEEIGIEFRRKRGYDLSNFEQAYTDAQYLRLANLVKTTREEKLRGEIGESVVLRPENFPELSRRQARKIAEYWKLINDQYGRNSL